MALSTLSSPLTSSANKIVSTNIGSSSSLIRVKNEYKKFGDFIEIKKRELESIPSPDQKKIKKLSSINIVNTFGSAGGLLGGLLGGALDLGGLITGFFPGEGKKVGSTPRIGGPKGKPSLRGGNLKIGGLRALGVANAVFAGLDFATGLAEGESIGKSAAGTSGALAGSLLGGAIGQALIPIPGVGFVIGSAAGSFLGGYTADRVYDTVTSQNTLRLKQEEKLKAQSKAQDEAKKGKVDKQNELVETFNNIVQKFEGFVGNIIGGVFGSALSMLNADQYTINQNQEGMPDYNPQNYDEKERYEGPISGDTFMPLPRGILSTREVGYRGGEYGAQRNYGGHSGQDIGGLPPGSPVVAWKTGKIRYSGSVESGDTILTIDHGDGVQSVYKHVVPTVPSGTVVYGGQQIATLFNARAYPPHLHFEIWKNGSHKNPMNEIKSSQKINNPLSVERAKEIAGKGEPTPTVSNAKGFNRSQITSTFGLKESFRKKEHEGIDIAAAQGTPISFKTGGEIVKISRTESRERDANGGYGNYIDVKLDNGSMLRLAHLSSISNWARNGGKFSPGEIIALSGGGERMPGSGRSSHPHIHLEQHSKSGLGIEETLKNKVDPLTYGGFSSLLQGGAERGNIKPRTSMVTIPPSKPRVINQRLPYQSQSSAAVINKPTIVAMGGGEGGGSRQVTPVAVPASSGGGATIVVAAIDESKIINRFLDIKYS